MLRLQIGFAVLVCSYCKRYYRVNMNTISGSQDVDALGSLDGSHRHLFVYLDHRDYSHKLRPSNRMTSQSVRDLIPELEGRISEHDNLVPSVNDSNLNSNHLAASGASRVALTSSGYKSSLAQRK